MSDSFTFGYCSKVELVAICHQSGTDQRNWLMDTVRFVGGVANFGLKRGCAESLSLLLVGCYCDDVTIVRYQTRHTWSIIALWGAALLTITTSDSCLVEHGLRIKQCCDFFPVTFFLAKTVFFFP